MPHPPARTPKKPPASGNGPPHQPHEPRPAHPPQPGLDAVTFPQYLKTRAEDTPPHTPPEVTMAATARHETRALLRAHLSAASGYRHLTRHCPICHRLLRLASESAPYDQESPESADSPYEDETPSPA
ncbi:hypothetical protein GCM10010306_057270 [Streptomyces umbrinus]|nr:hypothetical protein GCM10010306_057270 [Streptomyces umbrinus]